MNKTINNDSIRFIKKDDVFSITLRSNASTGYVWKLATEDNFYVTDIRPARVDLNPLDLVGGPSDMIYYVRPKHPGEHRLRFEKRRPWEKNSQPVETYEEIVVVSE